MTQFLTLGRVRLVSPRLQEQRATFGQPKRLALLAYLAVAEPRGLHRRDTLLALFWPDLPEEDGRRALRQALHYLRHTAGDGAVLTRGDEVGVLEAGDGALRCDAVEFETLLGEGRSADALALYQGDFFDGFHVPDVAVEYEEWVDRTRARLRTRAASGAGRAAGEAEQAGDGPEAVRWARRACELAPDDEAAWRSLMTLQDRLGDKAGALRTYGELAERLTREFETAPGAETTRLAEAIRSRTPEPKVTATTLDAFPTVSQQQPLIRRRSSLPAIGLALVLAAYLTLRATQPAAEPTLVTAGLIAPSDRILVADFSDLAGDPLLTAAVTEAFRVDLAGSRLVRVLSPRQARGALDRMQRSPDVVLDDSLAREVATREGLKALVTGSVARVAGAYAISLQLLGAREGELLVGLRETAADSNGIVAAVDRLSERLRARLGESLRELRAEPPLAQVTTNSLSALRHYSEGQRLLISGNRTSGLSRLEQAVVLDTGFASAWRLLGVAYGDHAELGRMVLALEHALANQPRLPFYERHHTIASYAANVSWDPNLATDAYQRVLQRYPDDVRALNNLGHVLMGRRRFAEAERLFARAASLDSTIASIHASLVESLYLQGNFEAARRELDIAWRRFPGHHNLQLAEIYLAAIRQDWELAERHAETRLAVDPTDTVDALDGYETLAGIVMLQGRLAEAERHSLNVLRLSRQVGSPARHLSSAVRLGHLELRYRRAPARAVERVERALEAFSLDSIYEGDRPYDELARFFAAAGDPARARELLDQEARTVLSSRRVQNADRLWSVGRIALAERRHQAALAALLQAAETHWCTICVLPDLARAYEASGNPSSAVVTYERYLATPWKHRFESDAVELGWVLRRLGELYESRGEPARAQQNYTQLLRLWRRADGELQPTLATIRSRLNEPR